MSNITCNFSHNLECRQRFWLWMG